MNQEKPTLDEWQMAHFAKEYGHRMSEEEFDALLTAGKAVLRINQELDAERADSAKDTAQ